MRPCLVAPSHYAEDCFADSKPVVSPTPHPPGGDDHQPPRDMYTKYITHTQGAAMTNHPLAQWLHQQLDHEELLARAARPGPWKRKYHGAFMHNIISAADGQALIEGLMETEDVAHVITHNPIRVLREIESKRRMINELWGRPDHEDMWLHHLKLLAIPYQDRPGYQEAIRGQP